MDCIIPKPFAKFGEQTGIWGLENREWELPRADLGVGPGGPGPPFCGLLNFSALHVQYGIQAFAKCKHPECIRLHPRELQSQKFPVGASAQNSLEKRVVRSPDGCYRAHIATVYNIPRPPHHEILRPSLVTRCPLRKRPIYL